MHIIVCGAKLIGFLSLPMTGCAWRARERHHHSVENGLAAVIGMLFFMIRELLTPNLSTFRTSSNPAFLLQYRTYFLIAGNHSYDSFLSIFSLSDQHGLYLVDPTEFETSHPL